MSDDDLQDWKDIQSRLAASERELKMAISLMQWKTHTVHRNERLVDALNNIQSVKGGVDARVQRITTVGR